MEDTPIPSLRGQIESQGRRITLEVAVSSLEGALAAQTGGADRVELSCALELGGLTPSAALMRQVRAACTLPVVVMIRPRPGGFVYSKAEFETMLNDAAEIDADGVAFGILKSNRTIDVERCKEMIHRLGKKQAVFHRAFDCVSEPLQAIGQLAGLGFARMLTSGQARTALEGAALIRKLVEVAAGRIEILPGAGIRDSNVAEIIRRTHCDQVHGTFSTVQSDPAGVVCDANYLVTDAQHIRRVRQTIDNIR
jgi:copper homeostasis protein